MACEGGLKISSSYSARVVVAGALLCARIKSPLEKIFEWMVKNSPDCRSLVGQLKLVQQVAFLYLASDLNLV